MSKLKEELVIASKSNIDEYSNINPLYKRVQQIKDTRVLYQPESTTHQIRTITEIIRSKISQTTDNQFWEFKRLLTIQDFEKQSRTFIKTLQEIFVDEHDRINFRREDINLSNLAIRSLIFNPLIINSTLLENLELDEFKVNPNTKKAERVAIYHDLIPIIKEAIIQKVEPINLSNFINENELNYFRLLRINSGKYEGYLIGSQRYGSNKQKGVFHTNIYNANLKTLHIENSYKEEIQLLTKIQYEVDIIHKEISNWSELKQYPERIEELKVSIIECLTNLKHVKNNVKSQLKEALESCVDLKDRKQKYNPGATAAKLIKAKSRLDDRFTEIKRIHGHIGTDKAIITQIIAHQEAPMDKFLNFIKENWKKLKILNQTNPLTKEEKSKIIKNLEIKIRNIQSLIFAPHITFKYAFEHEANILIEMLKNNENNISNETLAIKFLKLYLLTKIYNSQNNLQTTYQKFTLDFVNNKNVILKELKENKKRLLSKEVKEEINKNEYRHIFNKIADNLDELIDLISNYEKEQVGQDNYKNIKNKFKLHIEGYTQLIKTHILK